jgi:quercetin dioxygenase-like cupin family protein
MAKAGDEIVNPRTGQRMVFLKTGSETGGELVQIDTYNPPTGVPEPEHVHPFQESGAEVLSGSLRFRIRGEERSVNAGESITIPANTPHHFWNDGEEEAHWGTVVQARPEDGAILRDVLWSRPRWQAQREGVAVSLAHGSVGALLRGRRPAYQPAVGCAEGDLRGARTYRKATWLPSTIPLSSC